jgi:hypothetical protein
VPLLVVGLLSTGFLMGEDKKTENEPIIVTKGLPRYFSLLNLTSKQKNEILKVRAKHAAEIQKLTEQIAALREQEKTLREQEKDEMEKVLTAEQKTRLKDIISATGKSKKKTKEKPTEKEKPAEITKPK